MSEIINYKEKDAAGNLFNAIRFPDLNEMQDFFKFTTKIDIYNISTNHGYLPQNHNKNYFNRVLEEVQSNKILIKDLFTAVKDKWLSQQTNQSGTENNIDFTVVERTINRLSANSDSVRKNSTYEKQESELLNQNNDGTKFSKDIDHSKIFIVHGHDSESKQAVARFVETLQFTAIILHEQASGGKTIIEKIEDHTNVGFAIILYTPCDTGSPVGKNEQKPRARQNVVFEHGYLMGKLGRNKVCALVKDGFDIETPSDITGVAYIKMDSNGAWRFEVAKELRNAGYEADSNLIK